MTPSELPAVLPVALTLRGRTCLVVGGGRVATDKVRTLLAADARVHVVAPTVTEELRQLVSEREDVTWREGEFVVTDLDGVRLVVTATANRIVDDQIYASADERGLWVNSADDPERCSFYLTGTVRRDPVVVAITTAGASPAMARYLRERLDAYLEVELGDVARILYDVRRELLAAEEGSEGRPWSAAITDELFALVRDGRLDDARQYVRAQVAP